MINLMFDDQGRNIWLHNKLLYREASAQTDWSVAEEMFSRHWEEVEGNKIFGAIDMDKAHFLNMERLGQLICVAVVNEYDKIVGYCITMVGTHPYVKSSTVGTIVALFIEPEYRGKFAGMNILKFVDRLLQIKYNIKHLNMNVSTTVNLGPLLQRLGYTPLDVVYHKTTGE